MPDMVHLRQVQPVTDFGGSPEPIGEVRGLVYEGGGKRLLLRRSAAANIRFVLKQRDRVSDGEVGLADLAGQPGRLLPGSPVNDHLPPSIDGFPGSVKPTKCRHRRQPGHRRFYL